MINFASCTLYLIAKLIKHAKKSEHGFFTFLDNVLFKFCFTTAGSVCFGYWLLSLGGPSVMPIASSWKGMTINIYVHGVIGLIMLFELLCFRREHQDQYYYRDLVVVIVFGIMYFTTISLFAEFADIAVYPFLKLEMSIRFGVFIVLSILSFNSYQLYHFILKRRFPENNNLALKLL
jgi:hypothetical protein